jgi:hypothetical protein
MTMRTRFLLSTAIAVTVLALAGSTGITSTAAQEGHPPETEPSNDLDPPSVDSIVVHLRDALTAQSTQWVEVHEVSPPDHGLSPDNDLFDQAVAVDGRLVLPPHVGRAVSVSPSPIHEVDPSVEAGARTALRADLGREPTRSEIDSEVAAFDQRIEQINAAIADADGEIRDHYEQHGEFPRHLEEQWLEVAPRDPDLDEPSANPMLGPVVARALLERVALAPSEP